MNIISSSLAAGCVAFCLSGAMMETYAGEISIARELLPEEAKGKIAIVIKMVAGKVDSMCNYGKMNLNDKPMVVIARHCVVHMEKEDTITQVDYLVTPNVTQLFRNRGLPVEFVTPYEAPIRERSTKTVHNIVGEELTINGCIMGSGNAMQCWEIKGDAYINPTNNRQNVLKISTHDYARILISGDRRGGAITGMSGNVVLDKQNRIFGVVSAATGYNSNRPYQFIIVEPIRTTHLGDKTQITME